MQHGLQRADELVPVGGSQRLQERGGAHQRDAESHRQGELRPQEALLGSRAVRAPTANGHEPEGVGAQGLEPDLLRPLVPGGPQQEHEAVGVLGRVGPGELLGHGCRHLVERLRARRRAELGRDTREALLEQALLRVEVAADQGRVDPGVIGDLAHRGGGVPLGGEAVQGRSQQQPPGLGGVPAPRGAPGWWRASRGLDTSARAGSMGSSRLRPSVSPDAGLSKRVLTYLVAPSILMSQQSFTSVVQGPP